MWKQVKVQEKLYFIQCSIEKSKVNFVLFDLRETWCETLSPSEVCKKVKALNKRFAFSENDIIETLTSGNVQTVSIDEEPTGSGSTHLKLKYEVKKCPLNYECHMKPQPKENFHSTFTVPLLTALVSYRNQVDILRETIKKKDAELLQYRKEGSVLQRKTLSTEPFDFVKFDADFEKNTALMAQFIEIANGAALQLSEIHADTPKAENTVETKDYAASSSKLKSSPSSRKHKILELRKQNFEKNVKPKKNCFEYENSQSQSQSLEESSEENSQPKSLKQEETQNKCFTPQRKSLRSNSVKETDDTSVSNEEKKTRSPTKTPTKVEENNTKIQTNLLKNCKRSLEYQNSSEENSESTDGNHKADKSPEEFKFEPKRRSLSKPISANDDNKTSDCGRRSLRLNSVKDVDSISSDNDDREKKTRSTRKTPTKIEGNKTKIPPSLLNNKEGKNNNKRGFEYQTSSEENSETIDGNIIAKRRSLRSKPIIDYDDMTSDSEDQSNIARLSLTISPDTSKKSDKDLRSNCSSSSHQIDQIKAVVRVPFCNVRKYMSDSEGEPPSTQTTESHKGNEELNESAVTNKTDNLKQFCTPTIMSPIKCSPEMVDVYSQLEAIKRDLAYLETLRKTT